MPEAGPASARRQFLGGAGALVSALLLPSGLAWAEPHDESVYWIASHLATRLVGPDGAALAYLPRWRRLRPFRDRPDGWLEVAGRVPARAVGPLPAPTPDELAAQRAEPDGPPP